MSEKLGYNTEKAYQNQLKQCALIHFKEIGIPAADIICTLFLVFVILGRWGIILEYKFRKYNEVKIPE